MNSGFHKFLGKEDHEHRKVITYLQLQYPGVLFLHVPNEGRRTPFEQFKFKWLGGKAGFPDFMIFVANKHGNGLAIEMKVKPNKPTDAQKAWLAALHNRNYVAEVCFSFEEAKIVIDNYLKTK